MQSVDWQLQHSLGSCENIKFKSPTRDTLISVFCRWGPEICPPGDSVFYFNDCFFSFIVFHWSIIAFQSCVSFYFTHGNAYVWMPLSQFIPPIHPLLCLQAHSLCLHLYFCPANRFISTIFLDSILYALIYDICLSLSDLLHSLSQILVHPPHYNWFNFVPSYGCYVSLNSLGMNIPRFLC